MEDARSKIEDLTIVMRTLREAEAGGVEPPSTVLETAVLPLTLCSRSSTDLSLFAPDPTWKDATD